MKAMLVEQPQEVATVIPDTPEEAFREYTEVREDMAAITALANSTHTESETPTDNRPKTAEEIAAYETAYQDNREKVLGYVLRMSRNQQTAEEITQDTFESAWKSWNGYRDMGKGRRAWLYTIAYNRFINLYRKEQRGPTTPIDFTESDYHLHTGADPSAESVVMDRERSAISSLLKELPEGFGEVVIDVDLAGMKYKEHAAATGIPAGTAMSRLHRSRAQLRSRLIERAGIRPEEVGTRSGYARLAAVLATGQIDVE